MSDCRKYAEWISDAALDALAPGREAELLSHTADCEDCREAYRHARELARFVDEGVRRMVAGEPSAHFATRLHARIAEEHSAEGYTLHGWKAITAALAMAVAAAVVLVTYGPWRGKPQPPLAAVGPLHAQVEPKPGPTAAVQPGPNPGTSLTHGGDRGSHDKPGSGLSWGLRRTLRGHQVAQRVVASREPEVIVPPGQLEAVMEFAKAIQSGRIDGKQLLAAEEEANEPTEIKPLEIKPIEIQPLDSSQPDAPPKATTSSSRP